MNNLFKKLLWLLLAATMLMGVVSCSDDDDDDDDPKLNVTAKSGSTALAANSEVTEDDDISIEITNPVTKAGTTAGTTVTASDIKISIAGGTAAVLIAKDTAVSDGKVTATKKISGIDFGTETQKSVKITISQGGRTSFSITLKVNKKESTAKAITLTQATDFNGTFTSNTKTLVLSETANEDSVFTLSVADVADATFTVKVGTDDLTDAVGSYDATNKKLTIKQSATDNTETGITINITATKEGVTITPYALTVKAHGTSSEGDEEEEQKKSITKVEITPNKAITLGTGDGSSITANAKTDVTSKAGSSSSPTAVTITEATDIVFATTGATGDTATFSYTVAKGGNDNLPEGLAFGEGENVAKLSLPAASAVVKVTISATGYNSVDVYLAITYEAPFVSVTTDPIEFETGYTGTLSTSGSAWKLVKNETVSSTTTCTGAEGTFTGDATTGYTLTIAKVYAKSETANTPGAATDVHNGVEAVPFKVTVTKSGTPEKTSLSTDSVKDLRDMVAAAYATTLGVYATTETLADVDAVSGLIAEGKVDKKASATPIVVLDGTNPVDLALFVTNQTNDLNEKVSKGKVSYSVTTETEPTNKVTFATMGSGFGTWTAASGTAPNVVPGYVTMGAMSDRGIVKLTIPAAHKAETITIKVDYESGKELTTTAGGTAEKKLTTGQKLIAEIKVVITSEKVTLTRIDGTNDVELSGCASDQELNGGKEAGDLVDGDLSFQEVTEDGKITIKVYGTLKKVTEAWTAFSSTKSLQTGYFLPLLFKGVENKYFAQLGADKKALTGKESTFPSTLYIIDTLNISNDDKTGLKDENLVFGFADSAVTSSNAYEHYITVDYSNLKVAEGK